jgi:hypothetical protein
MRTLRRLLLAVILATAAACTLLPTSPKSGRCGGNGDCTAGMRCALDPQAPDTFHRCVPATDGGGGQDGGPDTGIDGQTPCTLNSCADAEPICDDTSKTCRACATGAECVARSSAKPACASGLCVECAADADCQVTSKPICDLTTNTCKACTSDQQCATKSPTGPGVCMFHQDGHCATDAETIYIQGNAQCPGAGTAAAPYCQAQVGISAVTATKNVVVIRGIVGEWTLSFTGAPITVIGQQGAMVTPGATNDGITISGADVFIRNVVAKGSPNGTGVNAKIGSTLRMDRCMVLNNATGGIVTQGAAFDIVNTVVANNMGATAVTLGTFPGTGPTRFAFNTVVDNQGTGVFCGQAYTLTGLLVNGNAVTQVGCTVDATTSSTDPPMFSTTRPYHLTATSPCVDKAGSTGFPPDDIDGDTRPQPQGGDDDCGADEFTP